MVVRLRSWLEKSRLLLDLIGVGVFGPLVMSCNGWSGICIVCRASIVADGGVFSPSIGRGGGRVVGLSVGVSFNGSRVAGVGVDDLSNGDEMSSRLSCRLKELEGLSGERSGNLLSM